MALIPKVRYPAQTDTDPAYPQGKARAATIFHDGTGTPLARDWLNDLWGLLQSLLASTGLAPSGTPDQVGASQYLEAVQATAGTKADAAEAAAKAYADAATSRAPLKLSTVSHDLFPGAASNLAAISALDGLRTIVISSSTRYVFDADDSVSAGGGIPFGARSMARNGSRILLVGSFELPRFSTNEGASWTSGSTFGTLQRGEAVIYVPVHSRFFVTLTGGTGVAQDVDGASTWSIVPSGLSSLLGGLAAFDSGDVIVCGLDASGAVAISRTIDGGVTWVPTAPTVPNAGAYGDSGTIIGNGGPIVYHVGRVGTSELRICSATALLDWQLRATLLAPSAVVGKPRILLCPDTGILIVVFAIDGGVLATLSRDQGVTWSAFASYAPQALTQFALARGRLFAANAGRLWATDTLG